VTPLAPSEPNLRQQAIGDPAALSPVGPDHDPAPSELVTVQAGWPALNREPGGVVPVTTSSNLGWPAEPEPTTDQEHLGWAEIVYGPLEEPVVLGSTAGSRTREERAETSPSTAAGGAVPSGESAPGAGQSSPLNDPNGGDGSGESAGPPDSEALQGAASGDNGGVAAPVDNSEASTPGNSGFVRGEASMTLGDKGVDELPPLDDVSRETEERHELAAVLPTSGDDTPVLQELAENARRRIKLSGQKFPRPKAPRVLTVANQKGGVGKTTTTVNVAAAMAQAGLKVLVVDLDPQGNASTALGIDHHADVSSIYDVLVDGTPLMDVIQPCTTVDDLYCAPATIDLAGAEIELVSLVARETRLQKAIIAANEKGHEFDYILIDCPPSLGLLTVNAMVAATEVFIPIQCEYYALEGLSQLLKNIELVRAHLNPALHVSTILLTMYDGRTRLSAQVADEVREHFPSEVLRTTVPRSVRVSEAPSFGETVMTYDPNSSGALSYLEAASEIAERGAAGRV
jgi:chromosome partitioning protein